MTKARPPTRQDRLKEVGNKEERSERETTREGMDPTPLCSSPSVLHIYLVFNWSILNINVETHLFFEFRFAAFPGKTIRLMSEYRCYGLTTQ